MADSKHTGSHQDRNDWSDWIAGCDAKATQFVAHVPDMENHLPSLITPS
jgi:hypothetical protein